MDMEANKTAERLEAAKAEWTALSKEAVKRGWGELVANCAPGRGTTAIVFTRATECLKKAMAA